MFYRVSCNLLGFLQAFLLYFYHCPPHPTLSFNDLSTDKSTENSIIFYFLSFFLRSGITSDTTECNAKEVESEEAQADYFGFGLVGLERHFMGFLSHNPPNPCPIFFRPDPRCSLLQPPHHRQPVSLINIAIPPLFISTSTSGRLGGGFHEIFWVVWKVGKPPPPPL